MISRNSQQLQIHAAVSPRQVTDRDLMRYITHERFTTVVPLSGGAEVLEAVIPAERSLTGQAVGAVKWPEGSVLVALLHGSEALVPSAEDVMAAGDVIYALVASQAKSAFTRLLKS